MVSKYHFHQKVLSKPSLAKSLQSKEFGAALRAIAVMQSNARQQQAINDGYAFEMRRWTANSGETI